VLHFLMKPGNKYKLDHVKTKDGFWPTRKLLHILAQPKPVSFSGDLVNIWVHSVSNVSQKYHRLFVVAAAAIVFYGEEKKGEGILCASMADWQKKYILLIQVASNNIQAI
ncbi:hypothetical protein ACJX0J_031760, partial [Zea mays]